MKDLESLSKEIRGCQRCKDISAKVLGQSKSYFDAFCGLHKEIPFDYLEPDRRPISTLFVAESPPEKGAGYFYDASTTNTKFRDTLFSLLNEANKGPIDAKAPAERLKQFNQLGYYLVDAVNCCWNKSEISQLRVDVLKNCAGYLARTIQLMEPSNIVLIGSVAKSITTTPLGHTLPDHWTGLKNISSIPEFVKANVIELDFPMYPSTKLTRAERVERLRAIK